MTRSHEGIFVGKGARAAALAFFGRCQRMADVSEQGNQETARLIEHETK
jgi:hypothetical protein